MVIYLVVFLTTNVLLPSIINWHLVVGFPYRFFSLFKLSGNDFLNYGFTRIGYLVVDLLMCFVVTLVVVFLARKLK